MKYGAIPQRELRTLSDIDCLRECDEMIDQRSWTHITSRVETIPCFREGCREFFPAEKISSPRPHKHCRFAIGQGICRKEQGIAFTSACQCARCLRASRKRNSL